jgi:hypothetical protein
VPGTVGSILTRVISQFSRLTRTLIRILRIHLRVRVPGTVPGTVGSILTRVISQFSRLTVRSIALASCCCLVKKIVS